MIGRSRGVIKSIRPVTGDVTDYWISRNETARHAGNEFVGPLFARLYQPPPYIEIAHSPNRIDCFSEAERSAVSFCIQCGKTFWKIRRVTSRIPLLTLTKKLDLYLSVRIFFLFFLFFFFLFDQHENFIPTRAGNMFDHSCRRKNDFYFHHSAKILRSEYQCRW